MKEFKKVVKIFVIQNNGVTLTAVLCIIVCICVVKNMV